MTIRGVGMDRGGSAADCAAIRGWYVAVLGAEDATHEAVPGRDDLTTDDPIGPLAASETATSKLG